ncbi:MAG: hypothetical protein B6D61_12130 [Bacteroidetes bacterium 4484_249]|nr:MAG: hypothetical protein B6D61_12130 [Bacteroidetes bacterium 4484_249]
MKILTFLIALFLTFQISYSQEKYAVIINAWAPDTQYEENSWAMANPTNELYYEFWNDVYLMWEMLYEKGFEDTNIYVIYNEGKDYPFDNPTYNNRYTAGYHDLDTITDYRAYDSAVDSVFTGLAQGVLGFPQIQEDDFFVLYIFGHGGQVGITLLPLPPNLEGGLSWVELADYLSAINCHKKVIIMQQCFSGSSIEHLKDKNTIIMTAANDSMTSRVVDELYFDSIGFPGDTLPGNQYTAYEREQYPGDTMTFRHGEFNFHLFNSIRGVDPGNQSLFYQTGYDNFSLRSADSNSDSFTSIEEAYSWIRSYDSQMRYHSNNRWDDPQLSDSSNISNQTSMMYPTVLHTDIGGEGVTAMHHGLIGISKEIHILAGYHLTIKSNARLHILNESKLIVDAGASLTLEDNVAIVGTHPNNQLVINGDIEIGNNVSFTSSSPLWDIYLNNNSSQTEIENAIFEKCRLHNYSQKLTIKNSTFNNCIAASSHRGTVFADSTNFIDTWLYIENTEDSNDTATIRNCSFTTNLDLAAIDLWNYDNYYIANNTIDGYYNGIQIMQSGYGQAKHQVIQDNTITNCTQNGIVAYNTLGSLYRNHIYNNGHGVWFGNHSSIRLYGNPSAGSYVQTQEIRDNTSYEVYASQNSFPIYFRYNVIIDEDNLGGQVDPLVYFSVNGEVPPKDVRYNCWGQNFDPAKDLYPAGYIWQPVWCPGIAENSIPTPDEDMYEVANNLFDAENYIAAKSMYEMLIDQYPESKFAKAAMQELFALEKFVTNDYGSLKQYYESNTTLQSDSVLIETGQYLISKCDAKLHNWPDAIGYHENIILNPETLEDSIFAIIDLGYVYFVMENSGLKSAYTGKLVQYKPASKEIFIENRNYLLSLLPGEQMSETMKGNISKLKEGELLQNVPNPFSTSTEI